MAGGEKVVIVNPAAPPRAKPKKKKAKKKRLDGENAGEICVMGVVNITRQKAVRHAIMPANPPSYFNTPRVNNDPIHRLHLSDSSGDLQRQNSKGGGQGMGWPIRYFNQDAFASKGYNPKLVGCKRQVEGCRDGRAQRCMRLNNFAFAGKVLDPLDLDQSLLKNCVTHFEHKLDVLAKACPSDWTAEIRRFPFVQTQGDPAVPAHSYRNSPYKCVRDWIVDSGRSPWFYPSIDGPLSKIPGRTSYEVNKSTNLCEGAHPLTN
ncbi:hypothetical protein GGG16DRAFT_119177 [Schizophyllum commune]